MPLQTKDTRRKITGTDLYAGPTSSGWSCDRRITRADGSPLGTVSLVPARIGRPRGWSIDGSSREMRYRTLVEVAGVLLQRSDKWRAANLAAAPAPSTRVGVGAAARQAAAAAVLRAAWQGDHAPAGVNASPQGIALLLDEAGLLTAR